MNRSRFLGAVCAYIFVIVTTLTLPVEIVCAQTIQINVNPKGNFLTGSPGDSNSIPTIIDLAMFGIQPGMVLNLERVGAYSFFSDPCMDPVGYEQRAIFSSNSTLLGLTETNRVPGGLGDIFSISHGTGIEVYNGVTVQVPEDAAYLFVMSGDSFYGDNQVHCSAGVYAINITVLSDVHEGLGYWRFEEGSPDTTASGLESIIDSTALANHGTPVGGPTYRGSVPVNIVPRIDTPNGSSIQFDGINDEISISSKFPFHEPGDVTLEFWLNTPATSHQSVFWTRSDDTDINRFNIFVNGNSTFGFDYRDANGPVSCGGCTSYHGLIGNGYDGVPIPRNTWVHLAIVRAGNTYTLYKNGVFAASAVDANPNLPTATGWQMSGRGNYQYEGFLDEVRISDRALSPSEFLLSSDVPNVAPIADAGGPETVHIGATVTLDGSGSSDPDGDYPLTYFWSIITKPEGSNAALSDTGIVNPTIVRDVIGDYDIELVVTDSRGQVSIPDHVTITNFNSAPTADAGPDQQVIQLGTTLLLDGSQSFDLDGDVITYAWNITSKPEGSLSTLDDSTLVSPSFVADVYGDYVIGLVVTDIFNTVSAPDTVTVSFHNVKPIANAGVNQSVIVGNTVSLDGSSSSDVNLDSLIYTWSLVSFPNGSLAAFDNTSAVQPSFVADLAGSYVVSLVVNDGFEDSDPSNITVVAISVSTAATEMLGDAIDAINNLDLGVLKNNNMRNALTNKINSVLGMIDQENYQKALDKLRNDILGKTNGCAEGGNADKNDWIGDCASQSTVYPLLLETITLLQQLI
jgi:hypothetical protein